MEKKHVNRKAEKLRNLTPQELKNQERDQMDQLFRLKFQMKMGQTESLTKIRELRRNVARLKTLSRQHSLGIAAPASTGAAAARPKASNQAAVKASAAKPAAKKSAAKGPAKKKSAKKSEKR